MFSGRIGGLVTVGAFHGVHTFAIYTASRTHGVQVAIIALQRNIATGMAVHATRTLEHTVHFFESCNRGHTIFNHSWHSDWFNIVMKRKSHKGYQ
ncbi:hypothetical protein D3C73_1404750 [compost metagenome]